MLSQSAIDRYVDIQCQILDKKIKYLQEYSTNIKSDLIKDFLIKIRQLERRKNKLIRKYSEIKKSGIKSYSIVLSKIDRELREICSNYNVLFSQLKSYNSI